MFLAPMNSMAANIEGQTVHSWGEVGFKTREGVYVKPSNSHDDKNVPSMTMKCEQLRFLIIDEIEGVGAEVLNSLESRVASHTSNDQYKRSPKRKLAEVFRPFGGVNVLFFVTSG